MDKVFGGDASSISTGAFVWAASLKATFISQELGRAGDMFVGSFPLSCLATENGSPASITVDDLIKISSRSLPIKKGFHVNNYVRNPQVLTKKSTVPWTEVTDAVHTECVEYVVLQKPFLQMQTGERQQFSIDFHVQANAAAFPRTDDSFARSLVQSNENSVTQAVSGSLIENGSLAQVVKHHLSLGGPVVSSPMQVGSHHISQSLISDSMGGGR